MAFDSEMEAATAHLTRTKDPVIIAVGQKQQRSDINSNTPLTRVYTRRWLVLFIFILFTSSNISQWVQYSIISNIIERYYNVSTIAVDWTSLLFMLAYIPLVFPISYMMDRIGLRWTIIVGCLLTALGSWIKVFSIPRDRFYVTFIGQSLVASTQVIVLNVPGRLAANWFGSSQVSTATSMGLFGFQLGIAGSFLLTPIVVRNHDDLDDIGDDLSRLFWFFAVYSTVALITAIVFLRDEPPLPPSETRRLQKLNISENSDGFLPLMKRLLSNRSYLALCHSFGINIGVLNSIATLLNQMYLIHFEHGEKEAGQIGLAIVIMGLISSPIFGYILDKTHKFKLTISAVYALSLLGQILFAVSLVMEIKWMVYVSATFLGFFITSYFAVGYEVCAEYTYPEPEGVATAFLNVTNQIYGIAIVLIFGKVIDIFGDLWAHLVIGLFLFMGLITTLCTKDLQKRQNARQRAHYKEVPMSNTSFQDEKQII
ncbi:uncharacterized MFS-type transporter C09D4.1-like [Neodiprion pinetum]|uniref:Uncharacterized MFS-type transporter C09D4.1 n=1 Tax=Neodiprion lecontei TaxID=441921 RepID=A0A6J0BJ70_NEOLC|nr:uncharacterized MFS-type transporter C09D4.1 [Neodiprion lecontei]XP_046480498.1 uncharacterized MFS-type transporter C09D4.1-like [Neodiprion pinetum]